MDNYGKVEIADRVYSFGAYGGYVGRVGEDTLLIWWIESSNPSNPIIWKTFSNDNSFRATRELFLDYLRDTWPQDFELILWHPEILEGRYDE